jgi:hypothetical protein
VTIVASGFLVSSGGLRTIHVIASEAKQSIAPRQERMDCFLALRPLRKRFAFVAGNDAPELNFSGDTMLTGSCLCGSVAYEVDADPGPIVHCHCRTCPASPAALSQALAAAKTDTMCKG